VGDRGAGEAPGPVKNSPTQRTLAKLRGMGYAAAVTEHWNPHVGIRQDMFGFIDVLGVMGSADARGAGEPPGFLAVQATTKGVSERVAKILALDAEKGVARAWLAAGGRIEVWGWTTGRSKARNADGSRTKRAEVRLRRIRLVWRGEPPLVAVEDEIAV